VSTARLNARNVVVFAAAVFGGFLATVVLSAADPAVRAPAQLPVLTPEQARGEAIYIRENCMACHTQQLRTVESEFGMVTEPADLGEAADPAQYARQNPALLGSRRVGPDLLRVGGRIEQADQIVALLRDPARRTPASRMPSYAHLSEEDLRALAAYLLSLR
jgi:cytochrome c oxidase cbb3-type subunit 2